MLSAKQVGDARDAVDVGWYILHESIFSSSNLLPQFYTLDLQYLLCEPYTYVSCDDCDGSYDVLHEAYDVCHDDFLNVYGEL